MSLSMLTTSVPEPLYVPVATFIVSPGVAFPIAPLIVAHGVVAPRQSLLSSPEVDTYQGPAARASSGARTAMEPMTRMRTKIGRKILCVILLLDALPVMY